MVAVEGVGTMLVGPVAPGHDERQSAVCVPSPQSTEDGKELEGEDIARLPNPIWKNMRKSNWVHLPQGSG